MTTGRKTEPLLYRPLNFPAWVNVYADGGCGFPYAARAFAAAQARVDDAPIYRIKITPKVTK